MVPRDELWLLVNDNDNIVTGGTVGASPRLPPDPKRKKTVLIARRRPWKAGGAARALRAWVACVRVLGARVAAGGALVPCGPLGRVSSGRVCSAWRACRAPVVCSEHFLKGCRARAYRGPGYRRASVVKVPGTPTEFV